LGNYPVLVLDRLSHVFRRPNTRFGHYSTMAKFYYHISRADSPPKGMPFMVALTSRAAGPRSFDIKSSFRNPAQRALRIIPPPPHDTLGLADTLPPTGISQLRAPRANRNTHQRGKQGAPSVIRALAVFRSSVGALKLMAVVGIHIERYYTRNCQITSSKLTSHSSSSTGKA
jgi:hypothetical protein